MPERASRVTDRPARLAPGRGRNGQPTGRSPRSIPAQGAAATLDVEESLLVVLRGIGATMFLTSFRIIVARDGAERRPRSGITSYALPVIRHLRLELGSSPSGRIAVWTAPDQEAVSMFFDARSLDRAQRLIDVARPLIARARRRGDGVGPVRPPSGPAHSSSDDPG